MFQLKHRGLFAKDGEVFPHASNCISQPKTAVGLAPALPGKNRSIVFFYAMHPACKRTLFLIGQVLNRHLTLDGLTERNNGF